ncbi:TetR/AcrR family transcriptional regulator [Herbivorax sp. ANBcel31]|uniref:TetR/AcrR family transcriptional regulator n=1 Tax=Herbivorax sp. ANBcel31 TaxID=3069754 RepID=UPI0027AEAD30|nr:TetR/AcrR family transcriptional regulator [Herbivorax sp. ANBcel31]MDQ2085542.1 TetR/AcrR family transcriptional regulator [Herbivorax sp. ANBcel31]
MNKLNEKKLKRLKEVATELFITRGYKDVTLDEIAQRTSISKMTIYKHYDSKEELFEEIVINLMYFHINTVTEELNRIESAFEKIEFILDYDIKIFKRYPLIFFKDIMGLPFVMKKAIEVLGEQGNGIVTKILNEGVKKGEIREINTEFASELLMKLPRLFKDEIAIADETKINWIMENLYNFIE